MALALLGVALYVLARSRRRQREQKLQQLQQQQRQSREREGGGDDSFSKDNPIHVERKKRPRVREGKKGRTTPPVPLGAPPTDALSPVEGVGE